MLLSKQWSRLSHHLSHRHTLHQFSFTSPKHTNTNVNKAIRSINSFALASTRCNSSWDQHKNINQINRISNNIKNSCLYLHQPSHFKPTATTKHSLLHTTTPFFVSSANNNNKQQQQQRPNGGRRSFSPFYRFALVRDLPNSFARHALRGHSHQSITSTSTASSPPTSTLTNVDALSIDDKLALRQHHEYVQLLQNLLSPERIFTIPADEAHPDCVFIEDTAIVYGTTIVLNYMGHPSRRGEVAGVYRTLKHLQNQQLKDFNLVLSPGLTAVGENSLRIEKVGYGGCGD